jgi:hypothetical protein
LGIFILLGKRLAMACDRLLVCEVIKQVFY